MKKAAILLLILSVLLCGCSFGASGKESVEFYFLRTSFVYGAEDGVVAAETRERSGDLNYLLSLYLRGPLDDELESPFPAGCKIVELRQDSKTLRITFDASFSQLEGLDRTLACACLAKTCFGLSDAQEIRIDADAPEGSAASITIRRDSLLLEDNSIPAEQTAPEKS